MLGFRLTGWPYKLDQPGGSDLGNRNGGQKGAVIHVRRAGFKHTFSKKLFQPTHT